MKISYLVQAALIGMLTTLMGYPIVSDGGGIIWKNFLIMALFSVAVVSVPAFREEKY